MVKVKKKDGNIVTFSATKINSMLRTVGFTGSLLKQATLDTIKEIKKVTKSGIVTATDFEKSVAKAIGNINKIAVSTTQKTVKRILR